MPCRFFVTSKQRRAELLHLSKTFVIPVGTGYADEVHFCIANTDVPQSDR
jgi:hypothetical protein